ncbi:MAG: 6-carboxytetrahydropterin synthase [Bacteroidales bacterium]|nr:6-carboxytetrahydropterin synthase [Bacteroidales bacterium]
MIYITRRERFNAAHRLFKLEFDDERNYEVFGKCSNPNWHGHNYVLFVTIKGEINPETGFLVNLTDLKEVIREKVIDKLDHKNLNIDVEFLSGEYTSTETLCVKIWEQLEQEVRVLGAELHKVKIQETENNFVEYFGN